MGIVNLAFLVDIEYSIKIPKFRLSINDWVYQSGDRRTIFWNTMFWNKIAKNNSNTSLSLDQYTVIQWTS